MGQDTARGRGTHRVTHQPSRAKQKPDSVLNVIAAYAVRDIHFSSVALKRARYCLMDALGCALQALDSPECTSRLGPLAPGTVVPNGARVPGTQFELDTVKATFDISCLIRWFDFNAVWYSGGSPADTLGTVLALCDYVSRRDAARGKSPLLMKQVLEYLIKAYEIHGGLSSANKIDRPGIGLDSTLIVKIAATAVAARILGGSYEEIVNALSNAFIDQQALNLYRVWPHTGPRKSWAAADAASRGVQFAHYCVAGEMGYPRAMSAGTWGFEAVFFKGKSFRIVAKLGDEVVRRVHFKLAFPAQRHCQSAAESGVRLHKQLAGRLAEIERVEIETHGLAMSTVNVTGPLANYAARDHCMQYIVAVALIYGRITTESYSDLFAADSRLDALRARMQVRENPAFTQGYQDPAVRSNPNAVQVFFKDGSATRRVVVEYPIGDSHWNERDIPLLKEKVKANVARRFVPKRQRQITSLLSSQNELEAIAMPDFMKLFVS